MTVSGVKQHIELDIWRDTVDNNIQSLRESRVGMKTTVSTSLSILSFIGIVLMLAMNMWQTSIANQQAQRAPQQQAAPR